MRRDRHHRVVPVISGHPRRANPSVSSRRSIGSGGSIRTRRSRRTRIARCPGCSSRSRVPRQSGHPRKAVLPVRTRESERARRTVSPSSAGRSRRSIRTGSASRARVSRQPLLARHEHPRVSVLARHPVETVTARNSIRTGSSISARGPGSPRRADLTLLPGEPARPLVALGREHPGRNRTRSLRRQRLQIHRPAVHVPVRAVHPQGRRLERLSSRRIRSRRRDLHVHRVDAPDDRVLVRRGSAGVDDARHREVSDHGGEILPRRSRLVRVHLDAVRPREVVQVRLSPVDLHRQGDGGVIRPRLEHLRVQLRRRELEPAGAETRCGQGHRHRVVHRSARRRQSDDHRPVRPNLDPAGEDMVISGEEVQRPRERASRLDQDRGRRAAAVHDASRPPRVLAAPRRRPPPRRRRVLPQLEGAVRHQVERRLRELEVAQAQLQPLHQFREVLPNQPVPLHVRLVDVRDLEVPVLRERALHFDRRPADGHRGISGMC